MEKIIMPDVILDLTDENKDIFEAIEEFNKERKELLDMPLYKRIFKFKRVKQSLKKAA